MVIYKICRSLSSTDASCDIIAEVNYNCINNRLFAYHLIGKNSLLPDLDEISNYTHHYSYVNYLQFQDNPKKRNLGFEIAHLGFHIYVSFPFSREEGFLEICKTNMKYIFLDTLTHYINTHRKGLEV